MKGACRASVLPFCILLALLSLVVSSGPARGATQYTITDLGTLGGGRTWALGVNASGQVVGHSRTASGQQHAFLWENGVMHDLNGLGGVSSTAYGINALGQVVGTADTAGGYDHAFLWESGIVQDLGSAGSASGAYGINASAQVAAGTYMSGDWHACLWEDGAMHNLGTLGGTYSHANGINDPGQVVGVAHTATEDRHAFLWEDGVMQDLGTLGGTESWAYDINASGQVVGRADTAGGTECHAFLWENGLMHDLGTLGGTESRARGINASGQVVGGTYTASGDYHAFVWENGVMHDLHGLVTDGSGWVLLGAEDINDLGQIVGYGEYGRQTRAFLLTPIPEPSMVGVVVVGAVGLLARRRRRN